MTLQLNTLNRINVSISTVKKQPKAGYAIFSGSTSQAPCLASVRLGTELRASGTLSMASQNSVLAPAWGRTSCVHTFTGADVICASSPRSYSPWFLRQGLSH